MYLKINSLLSFLFCPRELFINLREGGKGERREGGQREKERGRGRGREIDKYKPKLV